MFARATFSVILLLLGFGPAVTSVAAAPDAASANADSAGKDAKKKESHFRVHLRDARAVEFVGSFNTPEDVRRGESLGEDTPIGAYPCHKETTEKRTRCDSIVDIIAGRANDDRKEGVAVAQPHSLVTDSKERVLITDTVSAVIHIFDLKNRKYSAIKVEDENSKPRMPYSVAVDGNDSIYVTDKRAGVILVYNSHGKFQKYIGNDHGEPFYQQPTGIAADRKSGRIYVSDTGRDFVYVLGANGAVLKRIGKRGGGTAPGEFHAPTDIVVNGDRFLVLDTKNNRVQIFDLDGNFKAQVKIPEQYTATCLGADREGKLYLGTRAGTIVVLAPSEQGEYVGQFASSALSPFVGIWISPEDRIYLANPYLRSIDVFRLLSRQEVAKSAPRH